MRHFLRRRTGANSVLNKEKIRFNFLHTQHHRMRFIVVQPFSIFSFLILITYCILQVRYHQSNSCCISFTKVKRQYSIIGGWGGLRETEREKERHELSYVSRSLYSKYSRIIFTTIPVLDTIAHHFFHHHQPLPCHFHSSLNTDTTHFQTSIFTPFVFTPFSSH